MFEGGEYRMTNEAFAREIPFVICCVALRGQLFLVETARCAVRAA